MLVLVAFAADWRYEIVLSFVAVAATAAIAVVDLFHARPMGYGELIFAFVGLLMTFAAMAGLVPRPPAPPAPTRSARTIRSDGGPPPHCGGTNRVGGLPDHRGADGGVGDLVDEQEAAVARLCLVRIDGQPGRRGQAHRAEVVEGQCRR